MTFHRAFDPRHPLADLRDHGVCGSEAVVERGVDAIGEVGVARAEVRELRKIGACEQRFEICERRARDPEPDIEVAHARKLRLDDRARIHGAEVTGLDGESLERSVRDRTEREGSAVHAQHAQAG